MRAVLACAAALLLAGAAQRADAAPAGAKHIFVYEVRNGRASDLVHALSALFASAPAEAPAAPAAAPLVPMPEQLLGPSYKMAASPSPAPSASDQRVSFPGAMIGGGGTVALSSNDAANLLTVLATAEEYAAIETALKTLDRRPVEVFIEAAIVEVTLTDDLKYGLQFSYKGAQHQLALSDSKAGTIAATFPGLGYTYMSGGIEVVLDALSAKGHIKVISSPKLLVLNNKPAKLVVGQVVPIATEQALDITTSSPAITNKIQYRDTGVVLNVTPHVTHDGLIDTEISEEVSAPSPTTTSSIDSPTIQQRTVSTTVAIRDGETVALGGLIADQEITGVSGIPWLQDIPVLGHLFGDTGKNRQRTELVILMTPHLVASDADAAAATQRLREQAPAPDAIYRKNGGR